MAIATTRKDILALDATRFAMLLHAYKECSEDVQKIVSEMAEIVVDENSTDDERDHATDTLIESLLPGITAEIKETDDLRMKSDAAEWAEAKLHAEEADFANRLKQFMDARGMTQDKLANLTGVGQPAISNMLTRNCRPQRRTIARFAEALGVDPKELWPTT